MIKRIALRAPCKECALKYEEDFNKLFVSLLCEYRLVSLAQQLSLAAQAANKIEDFKQPSLVFARVYAKQGIKGSHTSFVPSKGFFVLRIQTKENPFEGTKEVCKEYPLSSWYFFNKLLF